MKKREKIWIICLLIVVVLAVILFAKTRKQEETNETVNSVIETPTDNNKEKYITELHDGTKLNISEELNSVKTYGNLEISNIQYTEKNGITVLLADVTNKGSTRHEMEWVKITVLNEQGERITQIITCIGAIEPGNTIELNASINVDVANAKDFTIEADN